MARFAAEGDPRAVEHGYDIRFGRRYGERRGRRGWRRR
jgi:hypothetical protein